MSAPQAPAWGALAWADRYRRAQAAGTAEARRPVPRRRALGSLVPATPARRRPGGAGDRRRSGESALSEYRSPARLPRSRATPHRCRASARLRGAGTDVREGPEQRISDGPGLGAEQPALSAPSPAQQSPFICGALAWAVRIARPRGAGTVDQRRPGPRRRAAGPFIPRGLLLSKALSPARRWHGGQNRTPAADQLRCRPLTPCGEAARRVGGDRGRVCGAGGGGAVVAVWPGRAGRAMSMPCGSGDVDALHAGARRAWGWARGAGVRSGRPAWRGRPPGTCCVRRGRPWRPPRRCGRCGRCSRGGGRWRRR